MEEIKAIETEYNGYRFRSRLEARWAVFFDSVGIQYEYEPDGFEVVASDNEVYRYLPDFYLPEFNVYVEIKPNLIKLEEELTKLSWCIDYGSTPISYSNGLIILGQIPYYHPFDDFNIPSFNFLWWDKGVCSGHAYFVKGKKTELYIDTDHPVGCTSAPCEPVLLTEDDLIFWKCGITKKDSNGMTWRMDDLDRRYMAKDLLESFKKAKQARFEHGEKPII